MSRNWKESSTAVRRTVLKTIGVAGFAVNLGSGVTVAQQNGSPTDINDWNDLDAARDDLDGDYVLVNNLNKETAGYDEHVADPGAGFEPIGSEETPFTGTFDGNGNEITGLRINRPNQNRVGLFGEISTGLVTDVTLAEVDITGADRVGGLVGSNQALSGADNSSITDVDVNGSVSGNNQVGGIIGRNRDGITDSNAACDVVADGNNVGGFVGTHNGTVINNSSATGSVQGDFNTGGFVGVNFNTIQNCRATGDVDGQTVGGFAGGNDSGAEITRSFATGDLTGNSRAGGFVGGNSGGKVTKSFATGTVSASENVGGFVGRNGNKFSEDAGSRAVITDAYALSEVTGTEYVGGFVGNNYFGDIERSYVVSNVSGETSIGGFAGNTREESAESDAYFDTEVSGTDDSSGAEGLSTAEMTGDTAANNMSAFTFGETWETVSEGDSDVIQDGYPILQSLNRINQIETQMIADTPAVFSIKIITPDDGEEVTENEALDVDVEVTNAGENEAKKTVELTTPVKDTTDLELEGGSTDTVAFEIPGDEVDGNVEITVESPNNTDQVSVTAVDPCFIATAAYDTPTAKEIDVLRDFRDSVLRQSAFGRLFIKTYYWGSPPIARWIRRNSTRRKLVKQYFVEPLISIVQTPSDMWEHE